MRLFATAAIAVTAFGNALAQPVDPGPVITNVAARDVQELSGTWTYSIDPYRDGLYGFHGGPVGASQHRYLDGDVDELTRENPSALYEVDMRRSPETTLPGAWDAATPELRHYEGLMWYERGFEAAPQADKRYFVHIGAANYHTRVYLNGELAGEHEGGFTPFAVEVTDLLREGENRIALGVDSERSETSVPPPVTDWETYGGVTRPIRLVTLPETFIDDAWIRLETDGQIHARVELDGPAAAKETVSVAIPELELSFSGQTDRNGVWSGSIDAPASLEKWSPGSPRLYDVEVTSASDNLGERIGFRTIEVDGADILLNGVPVFLRGISMHEEELGANPARTMTEDAARALLTEIRDGLGGNAVRLAHYPHSETTLRLADEMGLLVWSEIPVYWRIDFDNPETLERARRMLAENIRRDRNRASIALWSVANETPVGDDRNRFLRTLLEDVRTLDPTRLTTAALLTDRSQKDGELTVRISDPLADDLDVMAVNSYEGWYGGTPIDEVSEIIWDITRDKPLILSEFGAGAFIGFEDSELERKFSTTYQARLYRETLEMTEGIPNLRGMTPWILKDFRSPRRQHPVYQQGWNRKGLITETSERKPAFDVLADHYRALSEE